MGATTSTGLSWATWDRIKHRTTTSARRGVKTKTREEGMGTKERPGQGRTVRAKGEGAVNEGKA